MIISIEGNIGAGKTSVLEYLESLRKHNMDIRSLFSTCLEPLNDYTIFKLSGHLAVRNSPVVIHNPLKNLYHHPTTDAAIAQLHFMKASFKYFKRECCYFRNETDRTLVTERSYPTSKCFIDLYNRQGLFTPFVNDFLLNEFRPMECVPHYMIYLDVPPEVCLERIQKRQRAGEENMDLQTLTLFDQVMHDNLPIHNKSLKVSVDRQDSVEEVALQVLKILKQIRRDYDEPSCTAKM